MSNGSKQAHLSLGESGDEAVDLGWGVAGPEGVEQPGCAGLGEWRGVDAGVGRAGEVEPLKRAPLFEHDVDDALEALDIGVDRIDAVIVRCSPSPRITLAALSWSRDSVACATLMSLRRASGVTIGPILIRWLRVAATARATQGSAIGQLPSTGLSTWSQTNTPSSPASSAAAAISPNATRSANAPNNGTVNPCRTTPDPSSRMGEEIAVAIDHALG